MFYVMFLNGIWGPFLWMLHMNIVLQACKCWLTYKNCKRQKMGDTNGKITWGENSKIILVHLRYKIRVMSPLSKQRSSGANV